MRTTIYYFSATGNSMTTAYALAQGLENSAVIPVAATKNLHKINEQADVVGFVLPVYYGDMPYPVREMICKMTFKPDTYIFVCATYRAGCGTIAEKMDQLLRTRGQKLSLCVRVPMPGNSHANPPEVDAEHLQNQAENVKKALADILDHKVEDYFTSEILSIRPVDTANNFRGITSDENCTGCGTCVKVCPMNNIRIADGKSVIGDACSTCLACFHWCPNEAIYMSKDEQLARRAKYHHPDVTLDDIISQKN